MCSSDNIWVNMSYSMSILLSCISLQSIHLLYNVLCTVVIPSHVWTPQEELLTCDNSFVNLFGYHANSELIGENINKVLPSIKLPAPTTSLSEVIIAHRLLNISFQCSNICPLVSYQLSVSVNNTRSTSLQYFIRIKQTRHIHCILSRNTIHSESYATYEKRSHGFAECDETML